MTYACNTSALCICLSSIHVPIHPSNHVPIHPTMTAFMPQRQTLQQLQQSPRAMYPTWGFFGLMLYPLFSYECIQALREETSSLHYSAGADVHDNRTWQDLFALTSNLCDTKNHVMFFVMCQRLAGLCHLAASSAYVQSPVSLREPAVTCPISFPW